MIIQNKVNLYENGVTKEIPIDSRCSLLKLQSTKDIEFTLQAKLDEECTYQDVSYVCNNDFDSSKVIHDQGIYVFDVSAYEYVRVNTTSNINGKIIGKFIIE